MRTEYKYETFYIKRYNNGERNFVNERTIFNNFETQELLGEDQTLKILKIYAKKAKIDIWREDDQFDITSITLNLNEIDKEIEKLVSEVLKQSETVSGDDDVFDYFTDLVFAFNQICDKYNKLDKYKEIVEYLNKEIYTELGEPLS